MLPDSGLSALAVGWESGQAPTCLVEKGIRKKQARRPQEKETIAFWEVERKHVSGRSGGPLVDEKGYLIGICSGSNQEKGYFTHIEEIQRFLKRNGFRWLMEETSDR